MDGSDQDQDRDLESLATAPCSVAFKEWAAVCRAVASGRQSLILRKGGVDEASGEFRPEHPAFWLFPTFVHQAEQGLRSPDPVEAPSVPSVVPIDCLAVVEWVGRVDRVDQLAEVRAFHDWTDDTILQRFHYRRAGLWALSVRAYRRPEPEALAVSAGQLGCKTWVPLDPPIDPLGARPAIDPGESARRLEALKRALGKDPDA